MSKLLTIVIAAYNMHDYLRRCLDSICVESVMNDVQVIVVNDGSSDDTSEIAHEYEQRYPHYFHVIDKENGNYGSCMNVALAIAEGNYFRTLDADDLYDSTNYEYFVKSLSSVEVDMIKTPRIDVTESNGEKVAHRSTPDNEFHVMNITYRTDLLCRVNMRWSEGVFYTDHEYLLIPLAQVKTETYLDYPIYQYMLDREDQSVSWLNTNKNLPSRLVVTKRLLTDFVNNPPVQSRYYSLFLEVINRLLVNVYSTLYLDGLRHKDWVDSIEFLVLQNEDLVAMTDQINDFHFFHGGHYVRAYRHNRFLFWIYYIHYHLKMSRPVRSLAKLLK